VPRDSDFTNLRNDDIRRIIEFLEDIWKQLDEFIQKLEMIIPKNPNMYGYFQLAWEDVQPHFDKMEYYLEHSKTVKRKLDKVGLTGNQLTLKLEVYYYARNKAISAESEFIHSDSLLEKNRSWWKKLLGWTFENGDTILGSLGEAGIPGVGAFTEIKEVAEKMIKEPKR